MKLRATVLALGLATAIPALWPSSGVAMPVAPQLDTTEIVKVWGGCGPYGHRGPWGGCRRGGQWGGWRRPWYGPRPIYRPYYYRPYWRRYW